jgi:hypothetical protein
VVLDIDRNCDGHHQLPQDLVAATNADAGPGVEVVIDRAQSAHKRQNEER